jgi:flagellar biogenesis protein FliO
VDGINTSKSQIFSSRGPLAETTERNRRDAGQIQSRALAALAFVWAHCWMVHKLDAGLAKSHTARTLLKKRPPSG